MWGMYVLWVYVYLHIKYISGWTYTTCTYNFIYNYIHIYTYIYLLQHYLKIAKKKKSLNILTYCSVTEKNTCIIQRWNSPQGTNFQLWVMDGVFFLTAFHSWGFCWGSQLTVTSSSLPPRIVCIWEMLHAVGVLDCIEGFFPDANAGYLSISASTCFPGSHTSYRVYAQIPRHTYSHTDRGEQTRLKPDTSAWSPVLEFNSHFLLGRWGALPNMCPRVLLSPSYDHP